MHYDFKKNLAKQKFSKKKELMPSLMADMTVKSFY